MNAGAISPEIGIQMKIDSLRVSQMSPMQRATSERRVSKEPASTVSDTTDLLAISAGVSVAQSREATIENLKEAYRSGVLQPDPERIASRLLEWGFDPAQGGAQ